MKITNNSKGDIKVAVSRWGNDGEKASYYDLKIGKHGDWSRKEPEGFLMAISSNFETTNGTYFLKSASIINVETDRVSRDGYTINKL